MLNCSCLNVCQHSVRQSPTVDIRMWMRVASPSSTASRIKPFANNAPRVGCTTRKRRSVRNHVAQEVRPVLGNINNWVILPTCASKRKGSMAWKHQQNAEIACGSSFIDSIGKFWFPTRAVGHMVKHTQARAEWTIMQIIVLHNAFCTWLSSSAEVTNAHSSFTNVFDS